MNLDQIKNIIDALHSSNDEERNEAYQILESQKDDVNLSYLLAQLITDDQTSSTQRSLCLIIYLRMDLIFPPELFSAFLPLFNTDDIVLSNQLAYLLSLKLTKEEQMENLLESAANESLTYLYGVFSLLTEFFENYYDSFCDDIVTIFCTNFISQTQEGSFDESDINLVITIRGLATKVINLIKTPYEPNETNPESIPLLTLLLSLPITNELNIPVIQNILESSLRNLPPKDFFNICYKHLSDLSEMVPLPGPLITIASQIIWYIFFCYKYSIDEEEEEDIDTTELVSFAIQLSILNDDTLDRWRMNIDDFFIENINPNLESNEYSDDDEDDEFDDSERDYNFVFLRKNCLKIANFFKDEAINICKEIMRISPYHMEVAFYFLSNLVPTDYPEKFDLPFPDDDDSILYGQYIYIISSLDYEIDGGLIDECFEKEDDYLNLLVAKAICNSCSKTFIDRVVPATMSLFNMSYMFESSECSSFLEFITKLIKLDPISFQPYIESVVETLIQILQGVLSNRRATIEVIIIFSVFCKTADFTEFILDSTFPFIFELFESENSYLTLIGLDFLAALVAPLENCPFPIESIQPLFEIFIQIITDSLPSTTDDEDDEENGNNFIYSESMDSIMASLAFFARSFSPSPFASSICQWLVNAFECIRSSDFSYLPSCIVHLFLNLSEHEHEIELMKFLLESVINDDDSINSFRYSITLSLCALILVDDDYYIKCIEECGIDIRILLPLIPIIMDNEDDNIVHFIDDLILIATMFKLGDLIVVDNEEEKPLVSVALRTFFASFYHWFDEKDLDINGLDILVLEHIEDKRTYFNKDDPFFLNHPFRSMNSLIEFMNEFLPPLDQLPDTWQPNAQKILSYRMLK